MMITPHGAIHPPITRGVQRARFSAQIPEFILNPREELLNDIRISFPYILGDRAGILDETLRRQSAEQLGQQPTHTMFEALGIFAHKLKVSSTLGDEYRKTLELAKEGVEILNALTGRNRDVRFAVLDTLASHYHSDLMPFSQLIGVGAAILLDTEYDDIANH